MAEHPSDSPGGSDTGGGSGGAGGGGRGPVDARGVGQSPPPPPQASYMMPMQAAAPQRSIWGRLGASLLTTVLLFSIGLNVYLGIIVAAYTGGGPRELTYDEGVMTERIVIVPIEGMLNDDTHDFVRRSFRSLRDDQPAAVVLRIDCPGGYVTSSDRVWHEIKKFKEDTGIPVIASFASVAASGGYYVAAPADVIMAEPTTITGSIGVISLGFTVHELLDKIGVTPEVIVSEGSTEKDQFSIFRPWTDEERRERQAQIEPAYERFVGVVHEGRGHLLSEAEVRERATGAVFSADEAKELKLVDEIGYLEDAISLAAERGGLAADAQPKVTIMREPQGLGLGSLLAARQPGLPQQLDDLRPEQVQSWVIEMAAPRVIYGVPMR